MDSALARMETLVSIVMPTLNAQAWVVDTIDSVLAQTYPHIELIVVDDGSTDDTVDVVRRKLAADFKGDWRVIGLAENRGPSVARNVGLAAARGVWVQFLDSDDFLAPDKLARQMAPRRTRSSPPGFHAGWVTRRRKVWRASAARPGRS